MVKSSSLLGSISCNLKFVFISHFPHLKLLFLSIVLNAQLKQSHLLNLSLSSISISSKFFEYFLFFFFFLFFSVEFFLFVEHKFNSSLSWSFCFPKQRYELRNDIKSFNKLSKKYFNKITKYFFEIKSVSD